MKYLFTIMLCLTLSGEAYAASSQKTDELLWECLGQIPQGAGELGRLSCGRYIDGIMDMHSISVGVSGPAFFCVPSDGISLDQATRIFIDWANRNPKELHQSARMSVILSLGEAFPCQ